jgi:hypothetical protein
VLDCELVYSRTDAPLTWKRHLTLSSVRKPERITPLLRPQIVQQSPAVQNHRPILIRRPEPPGLDLGYAGGPIRASKNLEGGELLRSKQS